MPGQPISLRAYAKHLGVSVQAVSRAVAGGRLAASVIRVAGAPKIADVAVADAEWAANTDHARAPDYVKARGLEPVEGAPVVPAPEVAAPAPPAARGRRTARANNLADAAAREKNARADLAELDYQAKAGALVSAAEVAAAWEEMVTQMRTAMLGVPSKFKAVCPDVPRTQLAALNELLLQALESLASHDQVRTGAAA